MANTFKMKKSVAESLSLERSLAAHAGAPRLFSASGFLSSWRDGLRARGVLPKSVPSLTARMMIRANRERLTYFLTYYVGLVSLSPNLGEPAVEIVLSDEDRLEIRISSGYRVENAMLLMSTADILRLSAAKQRLLSEAAEELGVSVIFDQTKSEMCVRLGIAMQRADAVGVREESALERAALLSAMAAAFADLAENEI